MAESNGERSQEATPHRRQKAREEGQVAKSQDLASAVLLVVAVSALLTLGTGLVEFLGRYTEGQLGGAAWLTTDVAAASHHCNSLLWGLARYLLPFLGAMLLAAIVIHVAQSGLLFLPEKVSFDITRLDPLKGLQRIFSLSNLARLAFGIFKIVLVAVVAFVVLYQKRNEILGLTALPLVEVASFLAQTVLWTTMKIGAALLVLAVLDYGFQRWKFERDLRMTSQEVREEMKNLEGDPQVIARRRTVQRQLAMNRVSTAVPKADVIITNPTELAIAIQYDMETMAVPMVVAKGAGVVAQRIRRLALEHGIPIIEKKPLAQALFRDVPVNHPIPQDKYAAVAEILSYVYRLKGKSPPRPKAS